MKQFAITNVNLLDVQKQQVLENATVLVKGTKIAAVNEPIPQGIETIDGQGGYLMPGMFDMHAHFFTPIGRTYPIPYTGKFVDCFRTGQKLYIASGVTTVLDKGVMDRSFKLALSEKAAIEEGTVVGPRTMTAGLFVNKEPEIFLPMMQAKTVEEFVAGYEAEADQIDLVKAYINTPAEWFKPLCDAAHAHGHKVYAHLNESLAIPAIEGGLDGIEHGIMHIPEFYNTEFAEGTPPYFRLGHLTKFDPESDIAKRVAEAIIEHDVTMTPTITTLMSNCDTRMTYEMPKRGVINYYAPEAWAIEEDMWIGRHMGNEYLTCAPHFRALLEKQRVFLNYLHKNGVRILAGTDPAVPPLFGGTSMGLELVELEKCGMTKWEVLRRATIMCAEDIRIEDLTGSIEVGKEADMVLLKANPLEDLLNVETVVTTFKAGRAYDPEVLKKECYGTIGAEGNF